MKTIKRMFLLAGVGALLAGCATHDRDDMGGVGTYSAVGYGAGASASTDPVLPPSETLPMGPNGSVGPGNPLGIGVGSSGLQPAH